MTEKALSRGNDVVKEIRSLQTTLHDIDNIHLAGTYTYIPNDAVLLRQLRNVVATRISQLKNELKAL